MDCILAYGFINFPDAGNSSLPNSSLNKVLCSLMASMHMQFNCHRAEGAIELLQPDSNSNGDWLVTPLHASADGDVCGGDASP